MNLQERLELFNGYTGAFEDGAQSAWFNHLGAMDGNNCSTGEIGDVAQNHMRTMLSFHNEAGFLEGADQSSTGNLGQDAQAATSTSLRIARSGGMGKPSSWRLKRYPSMASRMFAKASCSVSPWLAQPGKLGTYIENPPAGSRSKMTLNRRSSIAPLVYSIDAGPSSAATMHG